LDNTGSSGRRYTMYSNTGGNLVTYDEDAASTRMVIDSSGTLLVGQTSINYNDIGGSISAGGTLRVCADSYHAATFNRKTLDGDIAIFYKDGTPVGSIGVASSGGTFDISGAANDVRITGGNASYWVTAGAFYGGTANTRDLGTNTYKWRDLYLSGGVYLGGTGSANKLDDYEEGTWTPSFTFDGSGTGITFENRYGKYTKIGNRVFFDVFIVLSSKGTATGSAQVSLPFSAADDATFTGHEASFSLGFASGIGNITRVGMFNGKIIFYDDGTTNSTGEADSEFTNSANFRVTGSYKTT